MGTKTSKLHLGASCLSPSLLPLPCTCCFLTQTSYSSFLIRSCSLLLSTIFHLLFRQHLGQSFRNVNSYLTSVALKAGTSSLALRFCMPTPHCSSLILYHFQCILITLTFCLEHVDFLTWGLFTFFPGWSSLGPSFLLIFQVSPQISFSVQDCSQELFSPPFFHLPFQFSACTCVDLTRVRNRKLCCSLTKLNEY